MNLETVRHAEVPSHVGRIAFFLAAPFGQIIIDRLLDQGGARSLRLLRQLIQRFELGLGTLDQCPHLRIKAVDFTDLFVCRR